MIRLCQQALFRFLHSKSLVHFCSFVLHFDQFLPKFYKYLNNNYINNINIINNKMNSKIQACLR